MRRRALVGAALAVSLPLVLIACTNKLSGELDVAGSKFVPESCRSGQALGFSGVELTAKDGRRIRVAQTASGDGFAIFFGPEDVSGTELGRCGPFQLETQSSTINNIRNVKGTAKLDCGTADIKVSGSVTFENCH
jgi:hypothetical protein